MINPPGEDASVFSPKSPALRGGFGLIASRVDTKAAPVL